MDRVARFALTVLALSTAVLAFAQKAASPLGEWKGESLCTVKPSACHDEVVVYEITAPSKNRENLLVWKADKIVEGRRENMGELTCNYDSDKGTVTCEIPNRGTWTLQVQGDTMTGTLRLSDGTLFRKVSVKRM